MAPRVSVIVPMFNEEEVVPLFVERLRPALDGLEHAGEPVGYEVVCVDDGSRDRTAALLMAARLDWPELRVVRLLRNAGHQAALTAGLESCRGDYAVTLDADLQDPPELVGTMLDRALGEGLDVVYGVRADRRSDHPLKRWTAHLYYRTMRRLSGPQLPDNAGDFRLVSRRVLDALSALPEHGRVYRLVIPWFGFPSGEVTYTRERRAAGRTKYSWGRMVSLGLDSVTAFSAVPLRLATWAGLCGTAFALFAMAWAVWGALAGGTVPGWTSTVATLGLLGAVQLLCLGLLGEYVARIFVAGQRRPTYLVGYDSLQQSHPVPAPVPTPTRAPTVELPAAAAG